MAIRTWTVLGGTGSGPWSAAAHWVGGAPGVTDSALINQALEGAYTVSEDTTATIAALSVGATNATLAFNTPARTLAVSGATILSLGTISIANASAALSTGTFSATGGAFTESNGLLSVTGLASFTGGADTISGGAFNAGTLGVGVDAGAVATLALSGGITTVSGLTTIHAAASVDGGRIAMSGGSLVATGGINFSGTSNLGRLTGKGTVSGGAITGAGTITAAGTLDIANAINSGPTLTISTDLASVLKLDGTATSAGAITINNANQTLEIGGTGALAIGAAENVTGGQITLDGGTLTDVNGISFGNTAGQSGRLSGFGTVAANLTRVGTGSADTIIASGGTLEVTGTIGAGLIAAIGTTSASVLKFDSGGTVAALSINNANQTLEIGTAGTLTLTGRQNIRLGKIVMSGGTLTDSSGIVIGDGATVGTLIGFGTLSAATAITKGGTSIGNLVEASGGTLILGAAIGAASGLAYEIAATGSSVMELGGTVGAGNTFTFLGAAGDLAYNHGGSISENIIGLDVGTTAIPTNFIDYANHSVTISGSNVRTGNSAVVTLSDGSVLTLTGVTHAPGAWFVNTRSDGVGTDIFLSTTCFAAGTRILTATGERMIESLMQGDIVLTLAGEELSAHPVKWIGRRRIDLTAHRRAETVAPIRIRRSAFAEDIPHRELLLSPDHAVFVDGKLICARQLINGTTIRQEKGWASVEYFHVELDAHAILLAEGLPTESYLDTGNRGFFANAGEPLVLHPDLTDETDYPARAAGSCAPFVSDEASVRPVWQRLAVRAAGLGQPAPKLDTIGDPELRIVAKGRTVRPLYGENGLYIFALPKGATEVRLVSRAGSPTDARPWLDDRRCLGVNVERIVLRGASEVQTIPLDHPGLSQGWWAVERDGTVHRRWTSGDAVLPLPALGGPTMLEIRAGNGGMVYVTRAEEEWRVA